MARDPKEKVSANGVARDAVKPEQKATRNTRRGGGDVADWGGVDSSLLREAITNVTARGFALLLGYTRDKGAYTIRIVGDEAAQPDYIRPTEDIDTYLQALIFDYE